MNFKTALLILSLGAAPAFAADQSAPLTREQVRAELSQAMRSGEMLSRGEASMTLREINPRAYPPPAATVSKTRSQVAQELNQAMRTGEILAAGESGAKLNEIAPGSYPSQAVTAQAKTRDEVRHELEEAIFHGEMMANGEDGRSVKEVFPGLYRGSHTDVATERGFTGHSQSL